MTIPTPDPVDGFSGSAPAMYGAPVGDPQKDAFPAEESGKSFVVTWLLSWFLGGLGVDRFYLGKVGTGIAKLLTLGGLGVWAIIDIILVLTGAQRDKNGRRLAGYDKNKKVVWIITLAIVVLGMLIGALTPKGSTSVVAPQPTVAVKEIAPVVEAPAIKEDKPAETKQAPAAVPEVTAEAPKAEPAVPSEFKSALKKAASYSETMHMSKVGLYDQLTSEYGEKFSPEAAQYAVDNVKADFKKNALEKAKSYQETMSMSPEGIRDQLVSEYGEKFTPEEADYAIQNLG